MEISPERRKDNDERVGRRDYPDQDAPGYGLSSRLPDPEVDPGLRRSRGEGLFGEAEKPRKGDVRWRCKRLSGSPEKRL